VCYTSGRMTAARDRLRALYAQKPVVLAPMEDVTDAVFRRLCRKHGATVAMTEFVNVEGLLRGCRNARRKIQLCDDDELTAIQIYGADPQRLAEAARFAESAEPLFIDVNCGCWVPKIAGRGAGAGWLRDPAAMVAMARMVVESVSMPVTVKTRIGLGPESHMPIVDLARRLEDAGVAAITIHCRTAQMGHSGAADWSWAAKARDETGCAGVMVGRRAIEHPWIFREARALLDEGTELAPPTPEERIALCREHLVANVAQRGEPFGVHCTRRHLAGYLKGLHGAASLRQQLNQCDSLEGCLAILDTALVRTDAAAA
jgi:tRNA-dihydrouridine synthase B